jgi:hypothetical protein
MQDRAPAAKSVALAGLVLYAISFVLPVASVPILEWTTRENAGTVLPLYNARQPTVGFGIASLWFLSGVFASPEPVLARDSAVVAFAWLANFPVLLFCMLFRRERPPRWLPAVFIPATVFAWLPAATLPRPWADSPLLFGYFVWAVAVTVVGVGVTWRTFRMRRVGLAAVAGAMVLAAACGWSSAAVRGATQAVIDDWRGGLACYQLGCTNEPPRDPVDFRIWELLGRDYRVHFETVGGVAPAEYHVNFITAYNKVADRILRVRFGSDYLERLRARAAADIYSHDLKVEGCFEAVSHTLMAGNETLWLNGSDQLFTGAERLNHRRVKVDGTIVDVRNSRWRELGRARVEVRNMVEVAPDCSPR